MDILAQNTVSTSRFGGKLNLCVLQTLEWEHTSRMETAVFLPAGFSALESLSAIVFHRKLKNVGYAD